MMKAPIVISAADSCSRIAMPRIQPSPAGKNVPAPTDYTPDVRSAVIPVLIVVTLFLAAARVIASIKAVICVRGKKREERWLSRWDELDVSVECWVYRSKS
jgi:hypothetical protein